MAVATSVLFSKGCVKTGLQHQSGCADIVSLDEATPVYEMVCGLLSYLRYVT